MAVESGGGLELGHAVALLGAAVVAAPLFRRLGLGSVLGYLAAGVIIGPWGIGQLGFGLFTDPEAILHVAELGVVMFLFIIGLEMRPAKLWALRREIFGLGLTQVVVCSTLLSLVGIAAGLPWPAAIIAASGFVLSSTAVIMKMLDDAGETATPSGQRAVSILLLEDLMIVPLLGFVAVVAAMSGTVAENARPAWQAVAIGFASVAAVFAVGRWLLNPMFAILARFGAREVMTAAALLVVLGAALFMQWGGLSMAMGAFLAGVLLSESTFRHQLEADIEPFRGILLALFFLSVGMSLDLGVVARDWQLIAAGVGAYMAVKALGIYGVARFFKSDHREALQRAALFAQGGEFAFVLFAAALSAGVLDPRLASAATAIVIISMALTPLVVLVLKRVLPERELPRDGVEDAHDLSGRVLFIGFGRFAQLVSQSLLARGVDISLIEIDVEMIQVAARFGFKIYYGDGARLDVLRAAHADKARLIAVCTDGAENTERIVDIIQANFPDTKLYVRSYDRASTLTLLAKNVDYEMRETFESAIAFGRATLEQLGATDEIIEDIVDDVRTRDRERLALQQAGGLYAGLDKMRRVKPKPEPFTGKRREAEALNPEAQDVIEQEERTEKTQS